MTLCLDLGTKTGFALGTAEEIIKSGTVNFALKKYEGSGMRYVKFLEWLDVINQSSSVTYIYYEEVRRHLGTTAAHVYGGLLAVLTMWADTLKIPYAGIGVKVIKKNTTGTGNANKEMVIKSLRNLGYTPQDDNEADAIALYLTVKAMAVSYDKGILYD